jgi:hypothetical protein
MQPTSSLKKHGDGGTFKSLEILENLSVPKWTKEFSGTVVCEDKGGG